MPIEIEGSGFGTDISAVAVDIGGTTATVVSVANDRIIVTAPVDQPAGVRDISVSIEDVPAASATPLTFTFEASAAARFGDFRVQNFATGTGNGNFILRGYVFRPQREVTVTGLWGGSGPNCSGFDAVLMEAEVNDPHLDVPTITLPPRSEALRTISWSLFQANTPEYQDFDTPIDLDPEKYYFIGQLRTAGGSGCHFNTESLDFENLLAGSAIIAEWFPRANSQYRPSFGGSSSSTDTVRILMGFRYETDVSLPSIAPSSTSALRDEDGDVAVSAVMESSGGGTAADETTLYFEISESDKFDGPSTSLERATPFRVLGAQVDIPFSLVFDGLDGHTTYHVRSVAINEAGRTTGPAISFKPAELDQGDFVQAVVPPEDSDRGAVTPATQLIPEGEVATFVALPELDSRIASAEASCLVDGVPSPIEIVQTANQFTVGPFTDCEADRRLIVTFEPADPPGAPSITSVAPADGRLDVAFTPPMEDGGSPLTNYEYSLDGGTTWTARNPPSVSSPIAIDGLENGVSYTVVLRATNTVGDGPASIAVAGVPSIGLPSAPPAPAPSAPSPVADPDGGVPVVAPGVASGSVGGTPVEPTPSRPSGGAAEFRVGTVETRVDVASAGAGAVDGSDGAPVIRAVRDRVATVSGGGMRPGDIAEVWMPLPDGGSRQVALLPVAADGTFDGALPFTGELDGRGPLPIGDRTIQLFGRDADGQLTVVNFGVRIEQPDPLTPEPDRDRGTVPTLNPGQSLATNAGLPTPVTVTPLPEVRSTRIEGDGWLMDVDVPGGEVRDDGGAPLIEIVNGTDSIVRGTGFMAGTRAYVWLMSDPTFLGEVTVGADGAFSGAVPIAGVEPGEHTLQLSGVGTDGFVRAANLGVVLTGDGTTVPRRIDAGGGPVPLVPLGMLLVAALLGAVALTTERGRALAEIGAAEHSARLDAHARHRLPAFEALQQRLTEQRRTLRDRD